MVNVVRVTGDLYSLLSVGQLSQSHTIIPTHPYAPKLANV